MTIIHRSKTRSISLWLVLLSASIGIAGCDSGKKNQAQTNLQTQPLLSKQLEAPSSSYLLAATDNNRPTAQQWLAIGNNNFQAKKYARALRAANEALNINSQMIEARQLAMLSAVKVTESNIGSYNDNALMNSNDKARLKNTFANMTTLVNTSN